MGHNQNQHRLYRMHANKLTAELHLSNSSLYSSMVSSLLDGLHCRLPSTGMVSLLLFFFSIQTSQVSGPCGIIDHNGPQEPLSSKKSSLVPGTKSSVQKVPLERRTCKVLDLSSRDHEDHTRSHSTSFKVFSCHKSMELKAILKKATYSHLLRTMNG